MQYLIAAGLIIIYIAWVFGSLLVFIESDGVGRILATASLVLWLAVLLWLVDKASTDKPCVEYKTTMQYNAATKTTMPVRYCAEYGEWVK